MTIILLLLLVLISFIIAKINENFKLFLKAINVIAIGALIGLYVSKSDTKISDDANNTTLVKSANNVEKATQFSVIDLFTKTDLVTTNRIVGFPFCIANTLVKANVSYNQVTPLCRSGPTDWIDTS